MQLRDQIEVYFQDDDLFVANDSQGRPTQESAENPDFYQLIFTRSTGAQYGRRRHQAGPGQLRSGQGSGDVEVQPGSRSAGASRDGRGAGAGDVQAADRNGRGGSAVSAAVFSRGCRSRRTSIRTTRFVLQFFAVRPGERDLPVIVSRHDLGAQADGAPRLRVSVLGESVLIDLNSHAGEETTAQEVVDAVNAHAAARALVSVAITSGNPNTRVGNRQINYSPLQLTGLGSSFDTATSLTDDIDEGPVVVVTGSGNAFVDGDFFQITDAAGGILRSSSSTKTRRRPLTTCRPFRLRSRTTCRRPR